LSEAKQGMKITKELLNILWHTKTCSAFNNLNYDNILYPNGIEGTEQYIIVGPADNKKHLEGYVIKKFHTAKPTATLYFMRSEDIDQLPVIINGTRKVHASGKVYTLVTSYTSINMNPAKIYDWRQIIQYSGIPTHTNAIHWTLYKNKRLFARTNSHVYARVVTESAFGKDKYTEAYRMLLGDTMSISDPSSAKIFYTICHSNDVTINELPDDSNKQDFSKMCNLFMRIGDKSNLVDNRARATGGTTETAKTDKLSVVFTHNVPWYYENKGKKTFEEIYPYNVINRYYYNLYEGFLKAEFPEIMDHTKAAEMYSQFYKNWIRSALWYEQNWSKLKNLYPNVDLKEYTFPKKEERMREHFVEFAKCLSHYAKDEKGYRTLLDEEYKSHQKYRGIINEHHTEIKEEKVE
jgi:hypothetical protein